VKEIHSKKNLRYGKTGRIVEEVGKENYLVKIFKRNHYQLTALALRERAMQGWWGM
ncbi:hypothetical protein THOM_1091, partial [Trachipleistophora hominis]